MTERLPRCEPMPKAVPCNTTLVDYKQIPNINNMTSQQSATMRTYIVFHVLDLSLSNVLRSLSK